MIPASLILISSLILPSSGELGPNCTTSRFIDGVESEQGYDKARLQSNQEFFRENCLDCHDVDVNGIMRKRCSIANSDEDGYIVYRCPNTDEDMFYVMNPDNCRIKYYTLCDDSASHTDVNLSETLKDLLCMCKTQQDYVNYSIGEKECKIQFDQSEYLFCLPEKAQHLTFTESCFFGTCRDNIDVDEDRFACEENKKGIYCLKSGEQSFIRVALVCDGAKECDDNRDEKNCDEETGVYCDAEKEKYVKEDKMCDRRRNCDNGADESLERCPDNYCKSADNDTEIFLSTNMLCNGKVDCEDKKDEKYLFCSEEFTNPDFLTCDNDTKRIRQKYLCSRNLCEDGRDMSEDELHCSEHELCPEYNEPDSPRVVCNTTLACSAVPDPTKFDMYENCKYCENGPANSYRRCKDSGQGLTCKQGPMDFYVPIGEMCDGNGKCSDESDESECTGGYYCANQDKKFVAWEAVCRTFDGIEQYEPLCDDGSDKHHCDSDFFEILRYKDKQWTGDYSDYLNVDKIFWFPERVENRTAALERIVKHRAFACQEYYYDLQGPKGKLINETIKELCVNESIFRCAQPYRTTGNVLNEKIMKSWMCQYPDYCDFSDYNSALNPKIEDCRNSSYCFSEEMKCNNENDCTEYKLVTGEDGIIRYKPEPDKTDEIGCSNKGLRCSSDGSLVEDAYICDGYMDCETEVDERICDGYATHSQAEATLSENCTIDRQEPYMFYHNYTLIDSAEQTYSLSSVSGNLPAASCDCSSLTGARYMAAVCSTSPGASNQPCLNSNMFNSSLCYPQLQGTWYSKGYNDITIVDEACKIQTKTISKMEHINNGLVHYQTFVRYHNDSKDFIDKSVRCRDPSRRKERRCGVPLTKMCDLINDCGDWSDEDMKYCLNNFECKNKHDKVTRVIAQSKTCNGASDCDNSQDECLDRCNEGGVTDTVSLLGGVSLLVVVWIFGVVSLIFNVYLIITMTKSALDVLQKVPHRFIYRILVTTIAIGDVMVSVYLVMLASVDTFREKKYCETKEKWLTGSLCITMGVISTFGNHVSLFAMVTLSLFRLKTVVHYLWPRTVNKTKAIQIAVDLVVAIMIGAILISTIPLIDPLKDIFVDRYYFPNRGNVFERGEKHHIFNTLKIYNTIGKFNYSQTNISNTSSWDDLLTMADTLFNGSVLIEGRKPYSFYSAYGVCLFNYLNSVENNSFSYVISIIALNLVCFLTIIASYLWIWKVGTKSKSTERQLQKKLSIAMFLNILCRLPLFMICLAHSIERFDESAESEKCSGTCLYYRYMSVFVIPINSVINPFINSEADLMDMIAGRCFGKRSNITSKSTKANNSVVTMATTLGTVTAANKGPGYKLSKVDPPSTLEEETTN